MKTWVLLFFHCSWGLFLIIPFVVFLDMFSRLPVPWDYGAGSYTLSNLCVVPIAFLYPEKMLNKKQTMALEVSRGYIYSKLKYFRTHLKFRKKARRPLLTKSSSSRISLYLGPCSKSIYSFFFLTQIGTHYLHCSAHCVFN